MTSANGVGSDISVDNVRKIFWNYIYIYMVGLCLRQSIHEFSI